MALSSSTKPNVPKMPMDKYYEYCNVKLRTEGTPNAIGEADWTWTAIDSDVKVDLQPVTEEELRRTGAGYERIATHRGFFLSNVDFPDQWDAEDEEQIMRIETDSDGDGTEDTYFKIVSVDDHSSHIEVLCVKVSSDA